MIKTSKLVRRLVVPMAVAALLTLSAHDQVAALQLRAEPEESIPVAEPVAQPEP